MRCWTGLSERDGARRKFTREIPADEQVESILHAGLHAPFAAAAVGDNRDYFRRFVVIRNGSKAMKELSPLVFESVLATAGDLEQATAKNAQLREQAAGFINRLAMIKTMGMVPGVGRPPFILSLPKRKGSRPWNPSPLPTAWRTCG